MKKKLEFLNSCQNIIYIMFFSKTFKLQVLQILYRLYMENLVLYDKRKLNHRQWGQRTHVLVILIWKILRMHLKMSVPNQEYESFVIWFCHVVRDFPIEFSSEFSIFVILPFTYYSLNLHIPLDLGRFLSALSNFYIEGDTMAIFTS